MPIPRLKERPIIHSLYMPGMLPEPRSFDLNTLIYEVKRSPECIGILKRLATDIVTEISFRAVESKKLGRPAKNRDENREIKAENFAKKVNFRKKLIALQIDKFMTGDYYGWIGKMSDSQITQIAKEVYKDFRCEFESKEFQTDNFSNEITSIELVPSSMTQIEHDNFKITRYLQKNLTNPAADRKFTPDEIVHQKLMDIDGSVYGFSPMEASYTTIKTIHSIQDFAYYYFKNGAKLDRAWKFMGNVDPNFIKKFEENLKQYKNVRLSHGDIVLANADKIEIESLSESEKDMQYRQLAIYSTGRLAFSFNMPADILSSILGADIKGTAGSSDIEDAGYNRNIEQAQKDEEELWNERVWIPYFGVEMVLERSFRQDQIRVTQDRAMNVSVAEFMFRHEFPVKDEFYLDILHIPRNYLIPGNIKKEIEMEATGILPGKPIKGEARQAYSDSKKKQQSVQARNNSPTGKELSSTFVSPSEFISEAKRYNSGKVRVMEKENLVYLKYSIPNTYEELNTVVSKEEYKTNEWLNIMPMAVPSYWAVAEVSEKEIGITVVESRDFIREAKRWGTGPNSLLRVRLMKKDNFVYLKFSVPHTLEEIHTRVTKEEYDKGDWMNIPNPINATWKIPPEINNLEVE